MIHIAVPCVYRHILLSHHVKAVFSIPFPNCGVLGYTMQVCCITFPFVLNSRAVLSQQSITWVRRIVPKYNHCVHWHECSAIFGVSHHSSIFCACSMLLWLNKTLHLYTTLKSRGVGEHAKSKTLTQESMVRTLSVVRFRQHICHFHLVKNNSFPSDWESIVAFLHQFAIN